MSEDSFPAQWFDRVDETPDDRFYQEPRFVTHIDDATIMALCDFYAEFIPASADVLDLMSSWISHLPQVPFGRVAGLGMNAQELQANPQLTEHVVHDLNTLPELPYDDHSFDRALIAVSVQYLVQPVAVLRSAAAVLRPGGRVCVAMSHRLFPTKAINAFRSLPPNDRVQLVAIYLDRAGFEDIEFVDRSPSGADPLWLVLGTAPRRD